MTIDQVLDWVDQVRPNELSRAVKIGFINEVESRVQSDILHKDATGHNIWCYSGAGEQYVVGASKEQCRDHMVISADIEDIYKPGEQFITYDELSGDASLVVPDPFSRLYQWYVASMVSLTGGNNEVYQYDLAMYQKCWSEYAAWYLREGRS